MRSDYYLMLDAMGIQDCLFDTNTLRIIIGGSLALAQWQQLCSSPSGGEIILSAGGNVLARFTGSKARDKAIKFKDHAIRSAPEDMEISWAVTQGCGDDFSISTWQGLQAKISRYKAGNRDPGDYPPRSAPQRPGCLHCGVRPQKSGARVDGRDACKICEERYTLGQRLKEATGNTPIEKICAIPRDENLGAYPEDLEELVTTGEEEREDLALVIVDLNDMGAKLREIIQSGGFSALKEFSEKLDREFTELFSKAVKEVGKSPQGFDKARNSIRIRPLFLGGDDALFAMPASIWIGFLTQVFDSMAQRGGFFQEHNISASAAVAVAKHTYPMSRMARMAEELLKGAKNRLRWEKRNDPHLFEFALDWHVHQESSFASPFQVRIRNHISKKKENRSYEIATRRPYLWSRFKQLLQEADGLLHQGFSNRKLYTLYRGLRGGVRSTRDALVYHFLRDESQDMKKYDRIWEWVTTRGGDGHPLWERSTFKRQSYTPELYDTEFADLLELRWFLEP